MRLAVAASTLRVDSNSDSVEHLMLTESVHRSEFSTPWITHSWILWAKVRFHLPPGDILTSYSFTDRLMKLALNRDCCLFVENWCSFWCFCDSRVEKMRQPRTVTSVGNSVVLPLAVITMMLKMIKWVSLSCDSCETFVLLLWNVSDCFSLLIPSIRRFNDGDMRDQFLVKFVRTWIDRVGNRR